MSLVDLRIVGEEKTAVRFTPADTGKELTFHCDSPASAEALLELLDDVVMGVAVVDLAP